MPTPTIDLTNYHITRSEKVQWRFPYQGGDPLEHIKSKGLQSFLRNLDPILNDHHITWEYKPVTLAEFETWLDYYHSKMEELAYDHLASTEWYQDRAAKGKAIEGLFAYRNGELVGSAIFTREGTEKATFAFKASDRIDLTGKSNSSLGAALDYLFLREMISQQVKIISAGQSRNAFGVINSLGYLDYKLRFGYRPQMSETAEMVSEVPLNEDGLVVFYGLKQNQFTLFAFKPQGSAIQFEVARFATLEIPFVEVEY